jgi:hypothetical protein
VTSNWLFKKEKIQWNSTYLDGSYQVRLGRSVKFIENFTKVTCLEWPGMA